MFDRSSWLSISTSVRWDEIPISSQLAQESLPVIRGKGFPRPGGREGILAPACFDRLCWLCTTASVLLLLFAITVSAGEPPTKKINGTLSQIDGVRVLRVWGTPQERGYAHGYLLGPDIVKLFDGFLTGGGIKGGPAAYEKKQLPRLEMMTIAPRYEAELRGMLAGIEAQAGGPVKVPSLGRALRYDDVAAVQCVPDFVRLGCASFAAWGPMTKDGGTIGGRNFDWLGLPALQGTQIVVAHAPSGDGKTLGWVSVTWPGFVGCFTGMNAKGVTISMHDVYGTGLSEEKGFTPRGYALREAIESARPREAFKTIGRILRQRACITGNNLMVTRPYAREGAAAVVFEYDGYLEKDKGVTVREAKLNGEQKEKGEESRRPFLACTNHYRKRSEPLPCKRFAEISRQLEHSARSNAPLDLKMAWSILRGVGMQRFVPDQLKSKTHFMTLYSVVFEPNKRLMHVAFSKDGKDAPESKAVTLDVKKLVVGE